ncbi:TVP38/TMEM64 family protein [Peribacillus frigoritolerans]|uniref:TVP38/TMEM64 family protein n=1 Tax=Peribacillus frigoritolerans TaxID=450367 RepID=UPI00105A961A|nr:TVP38/TMEM64 family protein [Peribacillus frigoritolerans]TDL74909.1 TVP38/TMEM64 family protein [Peribacillus frigoritolerans]
MKRQSWLINSLLCIAVVVGLVWFNHNVLHLAPEEIRGWILSCGWAAPVLFILIYTIRPLILFPASIMSLAGGLAFGPVWGTFYTVIGATLGAVLSFGLARVLGENLFRVRLEKWRKLETQLWEKGFLYILLLRLIPVFPFDLVSYAAGISKVKFWAFLFGTLLGIIPGTFAYNFLGSSFFQGKTLYVIIAAAVFILVTLIPLFLKKRMVKDS